MTNKHHQPRYISTPPVRWTNFCEIVFTKKITTMILFVLIFVTLIQNSVALRARSGHTNPWGENQRPKLYTDYLTKHSDTAYRFFGNQTHTDYFKLLRKDGQSLLIGARNVIYNISLPYLTENLDQRITWNPLDADRELCLLKGKSEVDCQNYIRVLAKTEDDRLLVCGTNAYDPRCRYYSHNETHTSVDQEFSGKGFCPYDPRHNSTFLYTDGDLYSATVADFSATDSLIIKDNLRTEQYDFKQLNSPDFVNALEDENHIYFFFREAAVEHINCGKTVFSRIARVCKSDQGGPHKFRSKWTTFLKSRLNCSVPGETPFYFNDIQATTNFVQDGSEQVVYGVFTTPDNAIAGSAICAFKMSDITTAFEEGPFKNQDNANSNWLPTSKSQIPQPRPGLCHQNTRRLPEGNLNFIKRHSLMDWAVEAATPSPIFIQTSMGERLTVIAADQGVRSVMGSLHDVLFVGTSHGRLLKISSNSNTLIEAIQVFPYHVPVRNILVSDSDQIIILSDHEVNAFPMERCDAVETCGDCVALQDPYCAWDLLNEKCTKHNSGILDRSYFIQDVELGYGTGCPISQPETTTTTTTSTTSSTTISTTSTPTIIPASLSTFDKTNSSNFTNYSKSKVTVNSPAQSPDDNNDDLCSDCQCRCGASDNSKLSENSNSDSTESALFPTLVPFYEDSSPQQRGNKEVFFEAPYGNIREEPAHSSTHYKESKAYSQQTLALSILLTALLALVAGFTVGLLVSRRCHQQKQLHLAEIYDKTLNFTNRAAHIMRGVGQRCSFNLHNATAAASASSSAASTTSTGSGSPPSSVHMCQIDSGYTTPSNLTHASVTTQETSAPSSSTSSASSTPTQGATPSASPNTIGSINLLMSMPGSGSAHTQQQPNKSELMPGPGGPRTGPGGPPPPPPMGQNYQTMPRNYMGQSQVAVMTAGGTLQKVKRIYL